MNQKFVGIQILRFVAAMLVVVMHLTQAVSIHITGAGPDHYWAAGSSGVDIFFVISGFVMAASTARSPSALTARLQAAWIFLKRRFLRIVPLYWFYTLAKAALLVALPGLAARSSIDPGHLTASLLFIPALSPWGFVEPTLPVGWTLNFEMLFYGVFALVIALGLPRIRFCLFALTLVFLTGRYFSDVVPLAFYAQTIVFEFVLGICIAHYFSRFQTWPTLAGGLALGIGLILMFGVNWGSSADRLLTWGSAAAFLVLGALWLEPWTAKMRALSPLSFLGDASYSIYLSHTFVVPAGVLALRKLGFQDMLVVAPTVLLAVVVSGCASYLWIERPMTRQLKRMLFKTPAPAFQTREVHHAK
jgi:exopolysaccharide production protein ExoZ